MFARLQCLFGSLRFNSRVDFWSADAKQWLTKMLADDTRFLFLAAIWWFWRHKNMVAYGDGYKGGQWLLSQILHFAADCRVSWNGRDAARSNAIMISWQRPIQGFIKLDVGGSSIGNPGSIGFRN